MNQSTFSYNTIKNNTSDDWEEAGGITTDNYNIIHNNLFSGNSGDGGTGVGSMLLTENTLAYENIVVNNIGEIAVSLEDSCTVNKSTTSVANPYLFFSLE